MAAAPSRGLGKGLSALISENHTPTAKPANQGTGSDSLVVSQLTAGKYQPRTRFDDTQLSELSASIAKHGIMQPILVRPLASGRFEIVAGERRWRAAKLAGLQRVPVIIRELTDKQALELAIVENVQRADLGPLEEALGYQRLIEEFDYTQEELATVVGKSRSHITNLLRLQGLPQEVKDMLDSGKLTMGHARALLTAENPVELAHEIVKKGLSVREAETHSKGAGKTSAKKSGAKIAALTKAKDDDILALEASLSESLGVMVAINDRGQSGEIVLSYDSLSQLDEILRRLGTTA
ncbi:MAG: ParB/RepB/Spo0J family partition protein [Alphaproteobacteria bacterium]|nr:ParB/RepB/Spo0J family partition protein [Alphaproteobacteria bacterium]